MKGSIIFTLICLVLINSSAQQINIKDLGATGDGQEDESPYFDSALSLVQNGGIIYVPAGEFMIRRTIKLPSNVTLKGDGSGLSVIAKAPSVKSILTINANFGTTSITVLNSYAFTPGDQVVIQDNSNYEWLSSKAVVTNVLGNMLTLSSPLIANYQTSRNAFVSTSFPLITNVKGSQNIVIKDLCLNQNSSTNDPANNFTISTIHWEETYNSVVEDCCLSNASTDAYSDQANDATGATIKSTKNIFRNNTITNSGRHGVHLGTMMNGALVSGNRISGCMGWALFYCAFVTHTISSNNLVENCTKGFAGGDLRDTYNVIANNIFKNINGYAIEPGADNIVIGNIITESYRGIFVSQPNCQLIGNSITLNRGGENIYVSNTKNIIISNCELTGFYGGTALSILGCTNVLINNLIIINSYHATSIQGVKFMKVVSSPILNSATQYGWVLQGTQSQDLQIDLFGTLVTTKVKEFTIPLRAIYN